MCQCVVLGVYPGGGYGHKFGVWLGAAPGNLRCNISSLLPAGKLFPHYDTFSGGSITKDNLSMCSAKLGYSCVPPRRSLCAGSSTSRILQVRSTRSVTDGRGLDGAAGRVKVPQKVFVEVGIGSPVENREPPPGSARRCDRVHCLLLRTSYVGLILSRIRALGLSRSVRRMTTGVSSAARFH